MNQNDMEQPVRPRRQARPRGFYAKQAQISCNVVTIDEDLHSLFRDEKSVNDALRLASTEWDLPRERIQRKIFPKENRAHLEEYTRPGRAVVIHHDNHEVFRNQREVNLALRFLSKKKKKSSLPGGVVELFPATEGPFLMHSPAPEAPMFTAQEQFG